MSSCFYVPELQTIMEVTAQRQVAKRDRLCAACVVSNTDQVLGHVALLPITWNTIVVKRLLHFIYGNSNSKWGTVTLLKQWPPNDVYHDSTRFESDTKCVYTNNWRLPISHISWKLPRKANNNIHDSLYYTCDRDLAEVKLHCFLFQAQTSIIISMASYYRWLQPEYPRNLNQGLCSVITEQVLSQ